MSARLEVEARPGDVVEVKGRPGAPPRRGTIIETLGGAGHRHFRVRWDEEHVSLFFPGEGEGVHVLHPAVGGSRRRRSR